MLASHNSLTAYPVKSWWFSLFNFVSKCQHKNLINQYISGVRIFDLRFAKLYGEWYAAHGLQAYDITLDEALKTLELLSSSRKPLYFRVVCEDTFYKSDPEELAKEIDTFMAEKKTTIKPICVRSKKSWELIRSYKDYSDFVDYNLCWDMKLMPRNIKNAQVRLDELVTTKDKMNLIGFYSSKFIPFFSAMILNTIAFDKSKKENDILVLDFI